MIVFDKLTNVLESREMKYIDLQREMKLSPSLVAKFQKNRTVTTETIDKVCEFLKVQPSDIMEFVTKEEYEQKVKNKERLAIEKEIARLQEQLKKI
jgi:DNA-binding Xre family transcriptional regulator